MMSSLVASPSSQKTSERPPGEGVCCPRETAPRGWAQVAGLGLVLVRSGNPPVPRSPCRPPTGSRAPPHPIPVLPGGGVGGDRQSSCPRPCVSPWAALGVQGCAQLPAAALRLVVRGQPDLSQHSSIGLVGLALGGPPPGSPMRALAPGVAGGVHVAQRTRSSNSSKRRRGLGAPPPCRPEVPLSPGLPTGCADSDSAGGRH